MSIEADPAGSGGGASVRATATDASGVPAGTHTPGAASAATAIRVNDLTLGFGQRAVLSNITTDVQKGAITALIGPTGSGKSTLLRTLNRMNDKVHGYRHDGDVLLDGRSIWHPSVDLMSLRRRVGMLFQRPNPFPMSIMENVVAGVRAHRMAGRAELKSIAQERLGEVGLWDAVSTRLKDSPFRLSGGQQQLLCLARALAIRPEVLLLDEPTSSLDPLATESIEALIRDLTPDITVVIVTHNLAQARRIADSTIFLYQGRMVEHGDTEQVFEHPAHEETARYVSGRFG
ncbi:MAG TPA: phosphate ABC transporter ATP-binding protein PstB [Streptosporangiaceae bacterium]|nr:phosphate ABC transporter ATP-binding protein PstB [Streptosporangiaceae bacterium]